MSQWMREHTRLSIYMRDSGRCVYCESPDNLTLDHLIPVSKGHYMCTCKSGKQLKDCCINHERNLVTACRACNTERYNKPWRAYAAQHKGATGRIQRQRRRSLKPYRADARVALEHTSNVMDALRSA
jgi:5-methylcytosine-specific restriction endonuclease McrA